MSTSSDGDGNGGGGEDDVVVLLDRFVSASTADDVVSSLERILDGLVQKHFSARAFCAVAVQAQRQEGGREEGEQEPLKLLLQVLGTGHYKSYPFPVDNGTVLAARIYLELLSQQQQQQQSGATGSSKQSSPATVLLEEPAPGRLVATLIDVAADGGTQQSYPRVLCLQVLRALCGIASSSTTVQQQLLQAPAGLHRLGELLATPSREQEEDESSSWYDEQVRNEALLLATRISRWPAAAKVWMFSDVADALVHTCLRSGGLTGGNPIVLDCLSVLSNCLRHDAAVVDLVFQSPAVPPGLARLLDLRRGTQFLNPPPAPTRTKETTAKDEQPFNKKTIRRQEEKDDLDDLLSSGSRVSGQKQQQQQQQQQQEEADGKNERQRGEDDGPEVVIPRLTTEEESVIRAVFDIFRVAMETDTVRRSVWKKHVGLCCYVWDLCLMSPPPPGAPHPCAVPSTALQQEALQVTALHFCNMEMMDQHLPYCMDRLLFLVCTGNGAAAAANGGALPFEDRLQLQQSALHVVRRTLTAERATEMLMQTLAPPMQSNDEDEMAAAAAPPQAVVVKLLNTALEQLQPGEQQQRQPAEDTMARQARENRKLLLSGSLGALAVFLTDEASRAVLLRLTSKQPPLLVDVILDKLAEEGEEEADGSDEDDFVAVTLLRFLATWMWEAPGVAQAVLSSSHSTVLSTSFASWKKRVAVSTMTAIVLGLAMEYMQQQQQQQQMQDGGGSDKESSSALSKASSSTDTTSSSEVNFGGWTASSIMDMIQGMGVSKFTSRLEQFKKIAKDGGSTTLLLPWSACTLEFDVWFQWYSNVVLMIRKRVVQQLTASSSDVKDDDDDEEEDISPVGAGVGGQQQGALQDSSSMLVTSSGPASATTKSLQRLVAQQANELEEIRQELTTAQDTIASQEKHLSAWKVRMESTPTELDTMLTEYTNKSAAQEQEIAKLQREMQAMRDSHSSELQSKDEANGLLEKQLQEQQETVREAEQERDSLREDMAGLSQAYSSLEAEYQQQILVNQQQQQQQQQHATAAGAELSEQAAATATGEGSEQTPGQQGTADGTAAAPTAAASAAALGVAQQQQQGGISMEVATLRAENTRLREDARAADEWMAMAMGRMNEMGAAAQEQQATAQAEITTLRQQLATLQQTSEQEKQARLEEVRSQLQTELVTSRQSFEDEMNRERHVRQQLEEHLEQTKTSAQVALKAEKEQFESEKQRLVEMEEMARSELDSSTQALAKAKEEQRELQEKLSALTRELEETTAAAAAVQQQQQSHSYLQDTTPAQQQHEEELRASISSLEGKLEATRSEMKTTHEREQEEIYHREARIRELESRLDGGMGGYTIQDIKNRDEEISQLKEANDQAQAWMSKAVEHHQGMAGQLAELAQQNSTLHAQNNELLAKNATATSSEQRLHQDLQGRNAEIERLQKELERRTAELESLPKAATEDELKQRISEMEALRVDARAKQEEIDMLESRQVEAREREEGLRQQKEQLETDLDALDKAVQFERSRTLTLEQQMEQFRSHATEEQTAHSSTAERLEEELLKRTTELDTLRTDLEQRQEEVDQLRSQLEDSRQRLEADRSAQATNVEALRFDNEKKAAEIQSLQEDAQQVRLLRTQMERLADEKGDMKHQIEHLQAELSRVQEADATTDTNRVLQERVAELESNVKNLEEQLKDQEQDADEAVAQWQESHASLQAEIETVVKEKEELEESLHQASSAADDADHVFGGSAAGGQRVAELESLVKKLEQDLLDREQEANNVISQWEERCLALEAQLQAAIAEKDSLVAGGSAAPSQSSRATSESLDAAAFFATGTSSGDTRVAELESTVQALEGQLEKQAKKSSTVISEWQESYTTIERQFEGTQRARDELEQGNKVSKAAICRLEEQIQSAEASKRVSDDTCERLKDRVSDLESLVEDLKERHERETASTILEWQERHAALQVRTDEAYGQLDVANKDKGELLAAVQTCKGELEGLRKEAGDSQELKDRAAELDSKVKSLEIQLEKQQRNANNIISQWQERCESLEVEARALEGKAESLIKQNDERAKSDDRTSLEFRKLEEKVKVSEERVAELEAEVRSLEEQRETLEQGATKYENRVKKLEDELAQQRRESAERDAVVKGLEGQLQQELLDTTNRETLVKTLEGQVQQYERDATEHAALVADLEGQLEQQVRGAAESSALIKSLEGQLEQQQQNSDETISQWMVRHARAESRATELQTQLDESKSGEIDLVETEETNEASLEGLRGELSVSQLRVSQLESLVEGLREELEEQSNEASDAIAKWEESYNSLQDKESGVTRQLEASVQAKQELAENLESAERQSKELKGQVDDYLAKLNDWQSQVAASKEDLCRQKTEHEQQVASLRETVGSLRETVANLEKSTAKVSGLETELRDAVVERDNLSAMLRETKADSENEIATLKASLEQEENKTKVHEEVLAGLRLEIEQERDAAASLSSKLESKQSDYEHVMNTLRSAEEKLSQKEAEHNDLLSKYQVYEAQEGGNAYDQLRDEVTTLRDEVEAERQAHNATREELTSFSQESEEVVNQWRERAEELVKKNEELEADLEQQREEADDAIASWESRCAEVEQSLVAQVSSAADDAASAALIKALQSGLADQHKLLSGLEDELESVPEEGCIIRGSEESSADYIASLKNEIELRNTSIAKRFRQEKLSLKVQMRELDDSLVAKGAEIEQLQKELAVLREGRTAESNKAAQEFEKLKADQDYKIAQLETDLSEAREECTRLEARLSENLKEAAKPSSADQARKTAEERAARLQQKLNETEELLSSRLEASRSEADRIKESLGAQRHIERERNELLERERDDLRNKNAALEDERDKLRQLKAELEDQLRETNDAMQVYVTKEVSDKATEIAARSLRLQVEELRTQVDTSSNTYKVERNAREAAEQEADRLRADLAALLGVEDNEEGRSEIQQRMMEATALFQRKERSEIEALKTSLARALDEVRLARAAEKEAQERAAKASLQVSMYEQEIVTTKSDLKVLTQTLDDMREAESTRRAAMEYRISSLENDQSVLRRFHCAELDNLRNELDQVAMERDRLFQSLKESEKSREALLDATSKSQSQDGGVQPEVELMKLRVEKTQLLAAAAEESSRAERRVREARAAEKSSAGADALLERELRLAAEKAVENMKLEMLDLKTEMKSNGSGEISSFGSFGDKEDKSELNRLKEENKSMSAENKKLRRDLEDTKQEARSTVDRLTEECRLAKARASHIEREGRYEAEVRAEVARLQSSQYANGEHRLTLHENPAEDDSRDATVPVADLYDIIQKQKQAIEEERSMYYDLSTEHEDLCAVLAQHDLIRLSLKDALTRAVGESAVEAAVRDAEEKAVAQYGQCVKLE